VFQPETESEQRYYAFPVGKLVEADTERNIPLHGYAIDDIAVFDGEPVTALEMESNPQRHASAPAPGYPGAESRDDTQLAAPNQSVTGQPDELPFTGRNNGSDTGGQSLNYRTLLYIRCTFADEPGNSPQGEQAAYDLLENVNKHIIDSSFGRMQALVTVTPLIVLPKNHADYTKASEIKDDAFVKVRELGYDPSKYGHRVFRYNGNPGTFGGLATVGANPGNVWIRGNSGGILMHELGHNYKLHHSNGWQTSTPTEMLCRVRDFCKALTARGFGFRVSGFGERPLGIFRPHPLHPSLVP
jgi:hypothetical protein